MYITSNLNTCTAETLNQSDEYRELKEEITTMEVIEYMITHPQHVREGRTWHIQ